MRHDKLIVFDIETIPDTEVVEDLTDFTIENKQDKTEIECEQELREELKNYHLEITSGKNDFTRQLFHKVVAISAVCTSIEISDIQEGKVQNQIFLVEKIDSFGKENSSEKELIQAFFKYVCKEKPRLVTFNGRTFDIPVLKYRAMKYGISAPEFYHSGDKWNSYQQRYSTDWNCDLLDVLSDWGSSARVKMNEVCVLLGLPGKIGVDGSKVASMFDDGKIKEIRDYCETDTINTYLVYLYYMRHNGILLEADFKKSRKKLYDYLTEELEKDKEKYKHFEEYLNAWNYNVEK